VIKILDEILISMQDYHEKKAPMLPPLKMLKPDIPKDEEEKKVNEVS
jgi:hypothetical protein